MFIAGMDGNWPNKGPRRATRCGVQQNQVKCPTVICKQREQVKRRISGVRELDKKIPKDGGLESLKECVTGSDVVTGFAWSVAMDGEGTLNSMETKQSYYCLAVGSSCHLYWQSCV